MILKIFKQTGNVTELCLIIGCSSTLTEADLKILYYLFSETYEPDLVSVRTFLTDANIIRIGPRLNFETPFSTNAVAICHSCGLTQIYRIELFQRYFISDTANREQFIASRCDRMTECIYNQELETFEIGIFPEEVFEVNIIGEGKSVLDKINTEMGLGFDKWDIDFYNDIFTREFKRNPTNVELFGLAQANSEHSRHKFFKGKLIIVGKEVTMTLMEIIKSTLEHNPLGNVSGFGGNASSVQGFDIDAFIPEKPGKYSPFKFSNGIYHITCKAETHNFPTGVAPFPGATTGTGGEIRDRMAPGLPLFGSAGYCVGNLHIPNYPLQWENVNFSYPVNLASPLQILIQASNGASDYGNKWGQPLICGFTRSFGMILPNSERREWLKPIMFAGGMGLVDARCLDEKTPEKGMRIVMLGGKGYRIGIGGGSASSLNQGENKEELDFNAVQRGDPEMEQKVYRVLRACYEMGLDNPIISVHDQGAGGVFNILIELVSSIGGKIEIRKVALGDKTLSVLETACAEYQERMAILIRPERLAEFKSICKREKVNCEDLGELTGDGQFVIHDEEDDTTPVNLDIRKFLSHTPQKVFHLERIEQKLTPLQLPDELLRHCIEKEVLRDIIEKVFSLPSVCSKGFLVRKVDRSVTGLVVQQQCCGPLQLPVSDFALGADSYFGITGHALSIGEQPIKMLIDPKAGARMAVGEALTNMAGVLIKNSREMKCLLNWMWPAKSPGEGARLYDAAKAACDLMIEIGLGDNGGKDSLTLATVLKNGTLVKSPGNMVVSLYAAVPDITKYVTPDIKQPGKSELIFIDLAGGKNRLGGSALAQCFSQIGNESPDVDNPNLLKNGFLAVQQMVRRDFILACHDRSDGGLVTVLAEMAMAGNCGIDIDLKSKDAIVPQLFSEELGIVIEFIPEYRNMVISILNWRNVPYAILGKTTVEKKFRIFDRGVLILEIDTPILRRWWEATSDQLEKLQADPQCVQEAADNDYDRKGPEYKLSFIPEPTPEVIISAGEKLKVAIIREEGSQCDRETAAAFYEAGFSPYDVMMTDLIARQVNLDEFRGIVFVGGFSYADVFGSAKGWAATIIFNPSLREMFDNFYNRPDTFSLGICNGCQLMSLLGWVPWRNIELKEQPRFIENTSRRFESRWVSVKIQKSPSIFFQGMGESQFGIWIAHGEGRLFFPNGEILDQCSRDNLVPVAYIGDYGNPTMEYPFNPNGSALAGAGLCSYDGRHTAIMPHPERAFLKWQWSWMPQEWKKNLKASPWLKMFQNARRWCENS